MNSFCVALGCLASVPLGPLLSSEVTWEAGAGIADPNLAISWVQLLKLGLLHAFALLLDRAAASRRQGALCVTAKQDTQAGANLPQEPVRMSAKFSKAVCQTRYYVIAWMALYLQRPKAFIHIAIPHPTFLGPQSCHKCLSRAATT